MPNSSDWLTAAQLHDMLKVPVGTIYRWASEDEWPRTGGRPVYYSARAAVQSHARRHAEIYESSALTCGEV